MKKIILILVLVLMFVLPTMGMKAVAETGPWRMSNINVVKTQI